MAWMPGAVRKPLPNPSKTKMTRYDLVVIHTMVGSLAGTDGYFRGLTNGVNSHFGTGGYGENWQWVDTDVRSGANGEGNHRAIAIENADMGPGFAAWNTKDASKVPPLTDAQIETNAQICAWANRVHGVPLVPVDTSRPNARGIGFHKLGCDPYRVPDGEKWSSSYGKICPAPNRIAQIPSIIARAQQIVGTPAVTDISPEEDDMPDLIAADGRGHALVSHGYITELPGGSGVNQELLNSAIARYGPIERVSTREFDLTVANALQGKMSPNAVDQIARRVIELTPDPR